MQKKNDQNPPYTTKMYVQMFIGFYHQYKRNNKIQFPKTIYHSKMKRVLTEQMNLNEPYMLQYDLLPLLQNLAVNA